jgi:hypothetical protein
MHRPRQQHNRARNTAGYRAGDPSDLLELGVIKEEFCDADADEGGESVAEKGVAGLAEGRADSVVFEDC